MESGSYLPPHSLDFFCYSFIYIFVGIKCELTFFSFFSPLQLGPSITSDISQPINNNADRPVLVAEKTSRVSAPLESVSRPPKMIKLDDQRGSSLSEANLNVSNSRGSAPTQVLGGNTVSKLEEVQYSEKQPSQVVHSIKLRKA